MATGKWHVSLIGGMKRQGAWRAEAETALISLVGGMNLDLTTAELATREISLTKISLVGGVSLLVPNGTTVQASSFALGGRDIRVSGPDDPDAPVVRIRNWGLFGGVSVRSDD